MSPWFVFLTVLAQTSADSADQQAVALLAHQCHACHSQSRMGGLDLTSREAAIRGGNFGAGMVPGQAKASLIYQVVARTHPSLKMPPSGPLKPEDVAKLAAWIDRGAVWPSGKTDAPPAEYRITDKHRQFWSFQPVRKPAIPEVRDTRWGHTAIDRFILVKLEAAGLRPSPPASRRTLIRRLYFDLLGLPPAPGEVAAFEADRAPDAYSRLIERLLTSPHYGERWGRYWLDVARYSDDQLASQFEIPHPAAFRYRDWVIQAFQSDMPYDQFVKAQFAGDLMPDPQRFAAGTGFFALSPEQQDDRVDAATRGFLGLTVACAQCHDHKFDPIPTKDYYSLLGVFLSTRKTEFPLAPEAVVKTAKAHRGRIEQVKKELAELHGNQARQLAKIFAGQTAQYVRAAQGGPAKDLDPQIVQRWCDYLALPSHDHPLVKGRSPEEIEEAVLRVMREKERIDLENLIRLGPNPNREDLSDANLVSLARDDHYLWRDLFHDRRNSIYYLRDTDLDRYLSTPFRNRIEALRREIQQLEEASPPAYAFLQTIADVSEPKDIRVRLRGNADTPGEIAPRRFLQILSPAEQPPFQRGSGRLELAERIADPANPLTARVIANRVWQWHFGRGIVGTASNFGQLGERPTHPELLDYLAARLVEQGWSIKALHREILHSAVYQQASQPPPANAARAASVDGDNRLLWRANVRRLDIESLRDTMLAVTGELDRSLGGQPRRLGEESNKRRTVYGFVSRRDLDPTLLLFDFANPNATSERRIDTSTPLQRLFLLNSHFVERRAEELSCRLERLPSDEARIRAAYEILFQRMPSTEELRLGLGYLRQESNAWPRYAQVLLVSNELVYID